MWRIVFLLVVLLGCSEKPVEPITMVPLSIEQWRQRLSSYQPSIVVVDLWASWCVSCIERFPHMVALAEKYQNKNITFVSLNLDDHEDAESLQWARQFLLKQNARFDHFHIDENLMQAIEKLDIIGIPVVLIYGRDGKERYRLTSNNPNNQFTEADVEAGVVALLSES